uniref:carnitine O-palmitoyltransferase n=1 Tax=Globodera pallida TaxID=36090 RepID=A0A183CBL0_GLOPA
MAEARNIAALSFTVTHDGISVSYDQEVLREIWHAFSRGYKRRIAKFKNNFIAGIFPANVRSLAIVVGLVSILYVSFEIDPTPFNLAEKLNGYVFSHVTAVGWLARTFSISLAGCILWFLLVQFFRLLLKWFLMYKGWMYESPHSGKISQKTKIWFYILHKIAAYEPMTHSFQGALPHLPLPSVASTMERHLRSMRPILSDKDYDELVDLSEKFQKGLGIRLQRYLWIKSWLSTNYVTDWWEKFIYLVQREPIMINSNYYGFDTLNKSPTDKQAARAANVTWAALRFRRLIEYQHISPFAINPRAKVPFCTMQYSRLFNSCRLPGEEIDNFCTWEDAKHIAVYCKGCWYKIEVHSGSRLHQPCELQAAFQSILDSDAQPKPGERYLGALTAGRRDHWAKVRKEHFSDEGNKMALRMIERAAFVVILDEEPVFYDPNDTSKLDRWAETLLHGRGYDRWFDKSFNLIISQNGRIGINAEHSWGDAAVTAHFMEYAVLQDYCLQGYTPSGDCKGELKDVVKVERLQFVLDEEVQKKIDISLRVAEKLIDDVEMALLVWTEYGKRIVKKLKISPDAFMQMALQLTYFRNQGFFSLTYEASITRLYREGRTETIRSCTNESCDFVRAMLDPQQTNEERLRFLRLAAERHQNLTRDAMCGKGVDRHLFALYVIMRHLEESSPFFDKIFPPQYLLSTSQAPLNQFDSEKEGIQMEEKLKLSSVQFREDLKKSLCEMRQLLAAEPPVA